MQKLSVSPDRDELGHSYAAEGTCLFTDLMQRPA
jgi:hypothetical protein